MLSLSTSMPQLQLYQPQPMQPAPYVHPDFMAYHNGGGQSFQQHAYPYSYPYHQQQPPMMASPPSMPFLGLPVGYPGHYTPPLTPPRYDSPTSPSARGDSPMGRRLDSPDSRGHERT